ncbi:MAG: Esterase [Actinomycetia bacterium]|nr:Esterase [Actinomycetes bacterium]
MSHLRGSRAVGALVIAASVVVVGAASARSASDTVALDPAWNGGAPVVTPIGIQGWTGASVVQLDGKVVTAGSTMVDHGTDGFLQRRLPDGTLDQAFGNGGTVIFDSAGMVDHVEDVALAPDGHIVVVGSFGYAPGAGTSQMLYRFAADGTLDRDFGPFGTGRPQLDAGEFTGVVVTETGDIVVAGTGMEERYGTDLTLLRYDPHGNLDPNFGGEFNTGSDEQHSSLEHGTDLVRLPSGAFVVPGWRQSDDRSGHVGPGEAIAARFTPTGHLDPTFGRQGVSVLSSLGVGEPVAALCDSLGRVDLLVDMHDNPPTHVLTRLTLTGAIDPTFGVGGTTSDEGPAGAFARDPQGRLVVATGWGGMHVRRYDADGRVDDGFGRPAFWVHPNGDFVAGATFQPDGKLLVTGYGYHEYPSGGVGFHASVLRLVSAPSPPPTITTTTTTSTTSTTTPQSQSQSQSQSSTAGASDPAPAGSTAGPGPAGGAGTSSGAPAAGDSRPTTSAPGAGTDGYWMLGRDGGVHAFGDARDLGGAPTRAATDLAVTPDGRGYWILDRTGRTWARGNARPLPPAPAPRAGESWVGIAPTRTGGGYWLASSTGRVFAAGDATARGDAAGRRLAAPIVDLSPSPGGRGYLLVGADGAVFTFGDAAFAGSMAGRRLSAPIRSLVPDPDHRGYWLVASDGGTFSFDARFRGSLGGRRLNAPITGMIAYGDGYLMTAGDGGAFTFSNRRFRGSLAGYPPAQPIVAIAATP